jgi:hypothetical protein
MNSIFETLKKLSESQRKPASYIYLDEDTGQINEIPLSKDMAASALINKTVNSKQNAAKEIHKFLFGN